MSSLYHLFTASATDSPANTALIEPGGKIITYHELKIITEQLAEQLHYIGVIAGDRVGVYTRKTSETVAVILATLKVGATYIPVDITAPPKRNAYILNDCSVKAVFIEKQLVDLLPNKNDFTAITINNNYVFLKKIAQPVVSATPGVAYILYTSGSTGKPKGVVWSHRNALFFVNWSASVFNIKASDRLSSHAPFHFDLSVFDLFVSLKTGASLVLFDEETGKQPMALVQTIAEHRITVWYSTPSVLRAMLQFSKMERYDLSSLRLVLFAGEVFPIPPLRALQSQWRHVHFFNLYGPTETNVCTFYKIPKEIPETQTTPFPIGKTCPHFSGEVMDDAGNTVAMGETGELCIAGPVMESYWNLPVQTAQAFWEKDGKRLYRTGDIVKQTPNEDYVYLERKDRMIKRRGYRVELGEIETVLNGHPAVAEAAVTVQINPENNIVLCAHIAMSDPSVTSLIEMKGYCAEKLPRYMIPDRIVFHAVLPKTAGGKIDYQKLGE